jgi:membrane peptidoglycan carboxypeptidase
MLRATGMPETWESGSLEGNTTLADPETGGTDSGLGIGQYEMRPIDQAVGFATLASGGIRRTPYFVAKVADNEGTVLLENAGDQGEQVIDQDVANDVTYALKGVADHSDRNLDGGREVASKTGTVGSSDDDNSDAWMVGYTPSIATAVWMGSDGNAPIVNARGRIIYGAGLPGAIWQQFMNTVLEGTPEEELPDELRIEGDDGEGVPAPEPEPTQTPTPTPTTRPDEPVDGDGDGVLSDVDPDDNDPNVPNGEEPVDADGDGVLSDVDPDDEDPNVPGPAQGQPGGTGNANGGGGGNGNG